MKRNFWIVAAILIVGIGLTYQFKSSTYLKKTKEYPMSYPVAWSHTKEDIEAGCQAATLQLENTIQEIEKTADPRFETIFLELEQAFTNFSMQTNLLTFYKYVSPDKELREVADACEQRVDKFILDIFTRQKLFEACQKGAENAGSLSGVHQKMVEDTLLAFEQNGLALEPAEREKFLEKKREIIDLRAAYEKNLYEWNETLAFSKSELKGLPDNFIQGLEQKDGKYILTLKTPHYVPVMEMASNPETRKKMFFAYSNQGGQDNVDRLARTVVLRKELAQMLGYQNHAELVLKKRMAKDPETVRLFLKDLEAKMKDAGKEEIQTLSEMKKAEEGSDTLHYWDWSYYETKLKREKYQVDQEEIKAYFELGPVVDGMFEIYQTLLNVHFKPIEDPSIWHDSVLAYEVYDKGDLKNPISYFYMDLFPRDGKYNHAAAFGLIKGYQKQDGTYQKPVASIVANFNAPSESEPSLLSHRQVETLFHEFGHIMHQVLTRADYASYSGTSVKRDFVEAPSQMLENWTWKLAPLQKMSKHHKTGEPLPQELVDKMVAAKLVGKGLFHLRQIFLASFDLAIHTIEFGDTVDTTQIWKDLHRDIFMIESPDGSYREANFGHMMGGYDAGYYGYLYSDVFASDMFTRFKEDLFSAKIGLEYRQHILAPGGSEDPDVLIERFLGRKPNNQAFLDQLGISL